MPESVDCLSREQVPSGPGGHAVGLAGVAGMSASGTCGAGDGRVIASWMEVSPSPGHPRPMSDLLELAGLIVLSALEEVEQDDVAQHRALGVTVLG